MVSRKILIRIIRASDERKTADKSARDWQVVNLPAKGNTKPRIARPNSKNVACEFNDPSLRVLLVELNL